MTKLKQASRRKFIAGSSSLLALTSVSNYLNAAALPGQNSEAGKQVGVVLYKDGDDNSKALAQEFADKGMVLIALSNDPVRQWRDGLSAVFANKQQTVIGLTNWSDYLIMRGLAAEVRRYPGLKEEQINGTPLFSWVIS